MAKEVELKLFFPASALARIEAHPRLAQASRQGRAETLESTYFDTPDLQFQQARIAIRTRKTRAGMLQTVKCAAESVGGLSSRPEWEQPFAGEFDFSAIEAEDVRKKLEREKSRLLPIFSTVFHRETRLVESPSGARILVMLDTGSVVSADDESPISELELELVAGAAADLQELAMALAADLPLIAFDQSKAERGYLLFHKEAARPMKAGRIEIAPSLTPVQAFQALAIEGQRCWQANLHGALTSPDPEFVHQFRVSLRRLNTLLRVFKPALPGDFVATWSDALKNLAGATGEVRDLDVMRESILLPMRRADSAPEHSALVDRAIAACDKAREAAELSRDRLANGLPLLAFVRDLNRLPPGLAKPQTARFAEKRLRRLHRKAAQRLSVAVDDPTSENAHRFRIALKHLRYSCEFFASLFDEAAMLQYAKEVAALQDQFGFINDLHVALGRFAQWSRQAPALAAVREYIVRWHKGRIDTQLTAALLGAEALLRQGPPWGGAGQRHGMKALRQRLKRGISANLA